jgi:methylenetetrahydrofolate reductase (NADPH)
MRKYNLSFEFFPPKDETQDQILFETVSQLTEFSPDFVSITYGAGGSTRGKTISWSKTIQERYNLDTMMHLTCYGNTVEMIAEQCEELERIGIKSILALRGDPTNNPNDIHSKAFNHAGALVEYITHNYPNFEVSVAGYPEKHPDAVNFDEDLHYLKDKVEQGAKSIISQLFFVNELFYKFMDNLDALGVTVPLIAGIMPVANYSQIIKFTKMCSVALPQKLLDRIQNASDGDAAKIGVDFTVKQCEALLRHGVTGFHFFTLNKHSSVSNIIEILDTV